MTARVPMLVLGGFLGAGKTTLLNRLLAGSHGARLAVLVNDFGELEVDGALVTAHDGETVRFANGCLCCAMGDDLVGTIDRLLASEERRPDRFVVEASGVADPAALADVATLHPELVRDLVVVLADVETLRARHGDRRLRETIGRQLEAADLLVLNKCDRVVEEERASVASWVGERVRAPIIRAVDAGIPMELLSPVVTDPTGALPAPGTASGFESIPPAHAPHEGAPGLEVSAGITPSRPAGKRGTTGRGPTTRDARPAAPVSAPGHGFVARTVACPRPLDPARLRAALASLMPRVLRAKGFVLSSTRGRPTSEEEWTLVQACGRTVDLAPWRPPSVEARPIPALVLIGLDDLPAGSELTRALRPAEEASS